MSHLVFQFTDPPEGTTVGRSVSVRLHSAVVNNPGESRFPAPDVELIDVVFGPGSDHPVTALRVAPDVYAASGVLAPATVDDSDVVLTATAHGVLLDEEGNPVPHSGPILGTAKLTVHLEPHPPELNIDHFDDTVSPPVLPFAGALSGTTSGVLSGITGVMLSIDGATDVSVRNDPPGDWSRWHATFSLPEYRDYPFTVTATDAHGRSAKQTGGIVVKEPFGNSDPAIVFGPTVYVRELCAVAKEYVRASGATAGPAIADLVARFRQPLDKVIDPSMYAAATAAVDQRRIAVEVLRTHVSVPLAGGTEQYLRTLAYDALVRALGTSIDELRQSRVASADRRAALAARLGIPFAGSRPDLLDSLTISPGEVTAAQLEDLFGFRSLQQDDPFDGVPAGSAVRSWRQADLRTRWGLEDGADRDTGSGALPVIDPDHVTEANLAPTDPADPVRLQWRSRRQFLDSLQTTIDDAVAAGHGTLATFDQVVAAHVGTIDLAALAVRDAAGDDVGADLLSLSLVTDAFRRLAALRALLAAGTPLLTAEWADVRDILIQVEKRRVFATWRVEERAADIVLQPRQFRVDPTPVPADPAGAAAGSSPWRADPAVHQDWQRTLTIRAAQLDRLASDTEDMVRSAEREVLPVARDALLAVAAATGETVRDTAERLTRLLCIDLLADTGNPTTRAGQAAQTLIEALQALRSGQLPAGTGPQWALAAGQEPVFDRSWASMGSYRGWYAALTSFAYPDNQLFPGLYRDNGVTLHTSTSYATFLTDLGAARVTRQHARDLAATNLDRVLPALDQPLRDHLTATLGGTLLRQENHTDTDLRNLAAGLASAWTPATEQPVREIGWLVPVALGLALTDAGDFDAALGWYAYAYAHQLPPVQRRIFPGLTAERGIATSFVRTGTWPAEGTNPHEVARTRADAYTRFTILCIARCLLAYADSEYVRDTAEANAKARALYETALDLLGTADAAPLAGPDVPFPANPVHGSLIAAARTALDKIHRGLNIAAEVVPSGDVSVLPSQYRYPVLIERAKNLVTTASQLEAAFLSAAKQAEDSAYAAAQADHDLDVAQAMTVQADLKVTAAGIAVKQAVLQKDRASIEADHYGKLLAAGANDHEREQLFDLEAARDLAAAGGLFSALSADADNPLAGLGTAFNGLSQAASLDAQIESVQAGLERQQENWQLQQSLAVQDVLIGTQQIALAAVQEKIAVSERDIAGIQLQHAAATAEFLATRFTNADLFAWMSGVLNQVYAYFLRQATALARLAQEQLAFERQEPSVGVIQGDYWQPLDPSSGEPGNLDRRGLTGAERLLADITRLDQQAFATDQRRLHLSETLSVARIAAAELQAFKSTGVLTFATPEELFDRRFPGHYLRQVKRVRLSMIGLFPPVTGPTATLSASAVSRTVVAGQPFRTRTLLREAESIAVTAPVNATGLFDLEPDTGLLLPFEGMGVDTAWRLELPRPANPIDYRTISDVLLTIDYTALSDPEHRQRVIRTLNRRYTADRLLSLREEFPDTWYDLSNPDTAENPAERMRATLSLSRSDFPSNIDGLSLAQLTLFAVGLRSSTSELTILSTQHTTAGQTVDAGQVETSGGIVGTRRPGGAPWQPLLGTDPAGTWELQFEDTPPVRALFTSGTVQDVVLAMSVAGTTQPWP